MAAAENHLIELLPREDRPFYRAICEPADLVLSEVVGESGQRAPRLLPNRRHNLAGHPHRR